MVEHRGFAVNTVAATKPVPSSPGSMRRIAGFCCALIAGCLLFIASRRLTWGRDQSLADWPLWVVAALPYLAYFGATRLAVKRFADLVKQSDFLPVWTVSLIAFVAMRASSLAHLYEPGIYDATV